MKSMRDVTLTDQDKSRHIPKPQTDHSPSKHFALGCIFRLQSYKDMGTGSNSIMYTVFPKVDVRI